MFRQCNWHQWTFYIVPKHIFSWIYLLHIINFKTKHMNVVLAEVKLNYLSILDATTYVLTCVVDTSYLWQFWILTSIQIKSTKTIRKILMQNIYPKYDNEFLKPYLEVNLVQVLRTNIITDRKLKYILYTMAQIHVFDFATILFQSLDASISLIIVCVSMLFLKVYQHSNLFD